MIPSKSPIISTILLNWNRLDLLRKTVSSYFETITVKHELIIVDNASNDGSREFIKLLEDKPNCQAILLPQNLGGEALNRGMARAQGQYLHISENDIEYLPGWDLDLLAKFERFPELGQLSPFSPFYQADKGEIWFDKAATLLTRDGFTLYLAQDNLTTTCVIRRELWDKGIRWTSLVSDSFRFPDDGTFSAEVKRLGYQVAWNDKYVVINWGHNVEEMVHRLPYYLENYRAKAWCGLEGLRDRLKDHGYDLIEKSGGGYALIKLSERKRQRKRDAQRVWAEMLQQATWEITSLIPPEAILILVDEEQWTAEEDIAGRRYLPFLEHEGQYWGAPEDDETAIRELERLRALGAGFIVFAWPAFWWLEYYPEFHRYLRSTYRCLLENERLVIFDLREG